MRKKGGVDDIAEGGRTTLEGDLFSERFDHRRMHSRALFYRNKTFASHVRNIGWTC
jgi:hypothetical protein